VVGCCEDGNEMSGSIKSGEFLGRFSDYQLLKRNLLNGIFVLIPTGFLIFLSVLCSPFMFHWYDMLCSIPFVTLRRGCWATSCFFP
jgi:hypothetical protein